MKLKDENETRSEVKRLKGYFNRILMLEMFPEKLVQ